MCGKGILGWILCRCCLLGGFWTGGWGRSDVVFGLEMDMDMGIGDGDGDASEEL